MDVENKKEFINIKKIVVYGFGKIAHKSIDILLNDFDIISIVDNDNKYIGKNYKEIPIEPLIKAKETVKSNTVIILATGVALAEMRQSLIEMGLLEGRDFFDIDYFLTHWKWLKKKEICISRVGVSVTQKCTLKCRDCCMMMPFYTNPVNYSYEMLCKDADLLFNLVDEVSSFEVIGGEPFIYDKLWQYLEYISENYGAKISNLQVVTNGTILPSQTLIDIIKKTNTKIRISDYSSEVSYTNKINDLKNLLRINGIQYDVFVQEQWTDFGRPYNRILYNDDNVKQHFNKCHPMSYWLHDGKYYFCAIAWAAEECGVIEQQTEYYNLEIANRQQFIDFQMGHVDKGYLKFCKRCRGFESTINIKAGVQNEEKGNE